MGDPRADALRRRDVAGRRNSRSPTANTATRTMPTTNAGITEITVTKPVTARSIQVVRAARGDGAQDEADDHADEQRERRDGQADAEADPDEGGDVGAVGPAGAEPAVQHTVEPVPVLDEEGPVQAPFGLDAGDGLRGRLLPQTGSGRAQSAQ